MSRKYGNSIRGLGLAVVRYMVYGLVVVVFTTLLGVIILWSWAGGAKTRPQDMKWGVTYSSHAARDLGLDVRETYLAILDDLKPQRLRLVAYWNDIESEQDRFDYSELDFQVAEAEKREVPYIIAIGRKVPRYPECFIPGWAMRLPQTSQEDHILGMIQRTVERYESREHLWMWQVENEPFLDFGECPKPHESFLKKEVDLVHGLSNKQIMLTDSGELSFWLRVTRYADVFGTTLYRRVLNGSGQVFRHWWWPELYTRHGNLIKKLRPHLKGLVVAELQAEPWGNGPNKPQSFYDQTMSHEHMVENIDFAERVGFEEVYLWGAEWWYYEKMHGDDFYWRTAHKVFD